MVPVAASVLPPPASSASLASLSVTVKVSSAASSTASSVISTRISCAAAVPAANVSVPLTSW